MNAGIRMSMPDMARRAQTIVNDLICRHGCKQALYIGRKIHEKIEAAYKSQLRKGDK